ncbi:UDP-N-acetylglucosamine 2-epimerase (non-hydrolyzing) [Campylobacter sp. MIT 99-7217]|uniref:non-hydrolyzing UDP-N-acetylglucosamine 2-epimerase n=1 Tax=Campylobacter sp. MIT 99-7217 TaxID=535091 RepID=UPI001157135C|nr:UDP-N-acetylglucosamine 2-epimerase (non-hydrolyzing) [Campylobacter sp. MIT 99-7217]TQR28643.1 UDP-N-acetylglucosamine 2-epimerase (non-hydrolyzing) [Campylobacter sp. MIT 99-7217]
MKRVLFVFGTRPEAIKIAPLIHKFKNDQAFVTKICVSAQHRQMLDQILSIFKIVPDYDLNAMKPNQTLFDLSSFILSKLNDVLDDFNPDLVFVHGDTTTAMIASMAAFYKQIKIAHVEAGLRTNKLYSPFPEEANRQIIGVLANYHFVPTQNAKENLLKENKNPENIIVVGNTVIDSLLFMKEELEKNSILKEQILKELARYYHFNEERKIILVTGHRRENFGQGFQDLCKALKQLALNNENVDIIYPVHLNPNVHEVVNAMLKDIKNVFLIPPLRYEEFVYLMDKSYFIITDSGGIQEEAPSLSKPILVTRNDTERPEAVQAGSAKLVGTDTQKIVQEAQRLLEDTKEYEKMSKNVNPYGDGKASEKILEYLKQKG